MFDGGKGDINRGKMQNCSTLGGSEKVTAYLETVGGKRRRGRKGIRIYKILAKCEQNVMSAQRLEVLHWE